MQLARADYLVVDVLADCEIKHAEAKRREHYRSLRRYRHPPGHHVIQRATQKVPVARELFGQMRRGVGLQTVLDVIDKVGRGEHDLRCEVAQRYMQYHRIVCEPRYVPDVRLTGDGGKDYQITGTDQLLGTIVHGDLACGA